MRKETNNVAHALAQNALHVYGVIVDIEDCPSCMIFFALKDLMNKTVFIYKIIITKISRN